MIFERSGKDGLLKYDEDGDKKADYVIKLLNVTSFSASDLYSIV